LGKRCLSISEAGEKLKGVRAGRPGIRVERHNSMKKNLKLDKVFEG